MISKSTLTATVVAAGIALFSSSPAWASGTTTYASPTGANSSNCTDPAQPCELQRAITAAPSGGEVVLAPGTYSSGFPVEIAWDLNVHGQAGEPRPTIVNDHSGCTDPRCPSDPAVVLNSPKGSLSHVRVVESGGAPGTPALRILNTADSEQETVEDVIAEGDDGIGIRTEGDALIRDTVAWAPNTPANAAIYATVPLTLGTVHLRLENVTAVASGHAYGLQVYGGCDNGQTCDVEVQMENSILQGGASDTWLGGWGGIEFFVDASHSNYRGVGYITDQGTNGNQTAEPQFVDPAHGDFHQLATSPTIDAGVASANLGAADIDGDLRSLGSAPDIGADEWVPDTQPQPTQPQQPQQPPVQPTQPPAQPQHSGSGSAGGQHSRDAKAFRGVHIRGGRLRLRHGKLRVRVSCPRHAKRYCKGTLTLKAAHHSGRAGHASFKLGPGRSKLVSVTVRRKLRKVRRFSVTVRAHDSAGHSFATHARVRVKRG